MCGSKVDFQSVTAEIRRGKKKEDRNHRAIIYCPHLTQGGHNKDRPNDCYNAFKWWRLNYTLA